MIDDKKQKQITIYGKQGTVRSIDDRNKLVTEHLWIVDYVVKKYKKEVLHIPNGIQPNGKIQADAADEILKIYKKD